MKIKVLVSVCNISGYLLADLAELLKSAEIVVVEVPCNIPKGELADSIRWIDRSSVGDLDALVAAIGDFKPDVYLCGGWSDKLYVSLARYLKRMRTRTVVAIDTPWQGKIKQLIHCLYSRFYLTRIFDYAWGAGEPQECYLHYLGFSRKRIRRGYYCADTKKFSSVGAERFKFGVGGNKGWPHVFLYIGRYVAVKNMGRMERAFLKALELVPESDWMLRCIGEGELWDKRTINPRIEHLGYKSPSEIQNYVKGAGCFVLPSVYEPWGVVVHEAVLMGLPMICSNQIQAATAYLKDGENGYRFDPRDEDSMAEAFVKIMVAKDDVLSDMGYISHRLGMSYTVEDWARIVKDLCSEIYG